MVASGPQIAALYCISMRKKRRGDVYIKHSPTNVFGQSKFFIYFRIVIHKSCLDAMNIFKRNISTTPDDSPPTRPAARYVRE